MKSNTEYFNRMLHMKSLIESNNNLKENIIHVFRSELRLSSLEIKLNLIGQGDHHRIYHVGECNNLLIAVRYRYDYPRYTLNDWLASELASFEHAYDNNLHVPYFVAAVVYQGNAAILTEDVSKNRTIKVNRDKRSSEFFRIGGKRYFLDPLNPMISPKDGIKYLENAILL